MGVGGHRRTALLNYENLPSLPPVWEYRALQREEEEDQDEDEDEDEYEEEEEEEYDEYEYSEGPVTPNGYHQESGGGGGIHRDALQNYVNTEQVCIRELLQIFFFFIGNRHFYCYPQVSGYVSLLEMATFTHLFNFKNPYPV